VRRSAPALCALLLVAAGCGGDDEPLRTVTVPSSQTIVIEGDEYRFDPGRVVVSGGGPVRINFENVGSLAHNVTVFQGERRIAGVRSFPPGEERSLRVNAPPGAYRLVCTVADHEELGMVGELDLRR
jgi:plastocyanin